MADLSTPLGKVVGQPSASPLAKHRDIHTVGDLLDFVPRRYFEPGKLTDLSSLVEGEDVTIVARVDRVTTRPMRQRKGRMLNATITDGKRELDLTFFSAYGHEGRLVPGALGLFAGTVGRYHQTWQLTHPDYQIFDPEEEQEAVEQYTGNLIPIYLPAGKQMPSWKVRNVAQIVLTSLGEIPDHVPPDVRKRRGLVDLVSMYRLLHQPSTEKDVSRGRYRRKYDEAFTVQTILAQRRAAGEGVQTRPRLPIAGGLLEAFDARMPFELTAGQQEVSAEIARDLAREHPMHRLLQGEVGSGKTVVALRAMLSVIDSGGQSALLAPTEVLASQHFRSITSMLGDLAMGGMLGGSEIGTQVTLLTGSQPTGIRRRSLLDAASGDAGIVVGTHALIQEHVQFFDLGLVVVDEQHRFGVEQRDALRGKGKQPPHVLVMTATPIPRTVAMTVFGDMETSTLTELPMGRSPIATHVVSNPRWFQRTWERVAEEVRAGHQTYVVCPRIGDSGSDSDQAPGVDKGEFSDEDVDIAFDVDESAPPVPRELRSVLQMEVELRDNPALAGLRIAILHGRMAADDKDEVMRGFNACAIDVLVATTVIEVGVDVANATVMVIMDADRFGISQLHQLRGRVGRGTSPGLCLLVTETESELVRQRLLSVAATNDGFTLARLDLEQRREGDVLGARQSGGKSQLRLLRLLRDEDLILAAREDAFAVVQADPGLEKHPALRNVISSALDDEQAAYLERG
ncbi:MAG TPA: ATP-dependent DNA helicase RecG [Dermatophilaceae bacterium]|nr:ATP-dependent DNA helicase RecG [Dermatophilaceae bacterium]